MKINISWLIILVLILVIIFQRSCKSAPTASDPEVITKIEVKYDTIIDSISYYIPKWHTKIETKYDTIEKIDTVKVIGDYYAKYFYSDTINKDSLILIVNDTLNQNKISSREVFYKLLYPVKVITKEIYPKKREFFIGSDIVGNGQGIYYVGPKLIYNDKKDNGYGFGIGIGGNDMKPVINIGVYWKL